jgi:hypothetical protein
MKNIVQTLLFILIAVFTVSCANQAGSRNAMAAAESGGIGYIVPATAEITKVSYYLDDYKGKKTIFFEISLKNISDQPKRFKVTVDIPNGPSSAYYYPESGKPPVLKPGELHVKPMPMVIYDKLPGQFTIIVKELEI